MVVVPGRAGELGVLPRHIPLIAQLKPGETRIRTLDDEWLSYATGAGYFKVQHDRASVLVGVGRGRSRRSTPIARAATSRTPSAGSPRRPARMPPPRARAPSATSPTPRTASRSPGAPSALAARTVAERARPREGSRRPALSLRCAPGYDGGMVSGRRRRLPGAQSAVRWVAVDARDVTCIHGSSAGPAVAFPGDVAVATVEAGLGALAAPCGAAAPAGRRPPRACSSDSAPPASCNSARWRAERWIRPWLLPAAVLAVAAIGVGVAHRTSPAAAARLLDRDLDLGAEVTTALELETSAEARGSSRGLGALALADVRGALGRSLPGARARLRPQRRETALLAALVPAVAALLLVSSPRTGTPAAAAAAATPGAKAVNRALKVEDGVPGGTTGEGGASLQGLAPPADRRAAARAGGGRRHETRGRRDVWWQR